MMELVNLLLLYVLWKVLNAGSHRSKLTGNKDRPYWFWD